MSKNTKRIFIKVPNGDMINIADVCSVKLASKGVTLFGVTNRLVHFISELDVDMATLIRDEVINSVEAAAEGRKYQPDWDSNTHTAA